MTEARNGIIAPEEALSELTVLERELAALQEMLDLPGWALFIREVKKAREQIRDSKDLVERNDMGRFALEQALLTGSSVELERMIRYGEEHEKLLLGRMNFLSRIAGKIKPDRKVDGTTGY